MLAQHFIHITILFCILATAMMVLNFDIISTSQTHIIIHIFSKGAIYNLYTEVAYLYTQGIAIKICLLLKLFYQCALTLYH